MHVGQRGKDLFGCVKNAFSGLCSPAKYHHTQDQPWRPGTEDFGAAMSMGAAGLSFFNGIVTVESPDFLGMPYFQEQDQRRHRTDGSHHIHQPWSMII